MRTGERAVFPPEAGEVGKDGFELPSLSLWLAGANWTDLLVGHDTLRVGVKVWHADEERGSFERTGPGHLLDEVAHVLAGVTRSS